MPEDTALLALIEKHRPKPKPKGAETSLVAALLKRAAFMPTVMLRRNNVGVLKDRNGRYVSYGLGIGSSDLVGYQSVTITQAMVGQRFARFVACEAKAPSGELRDRQVAFLEQCRAAGAIAVCVRTVEELEEALR